MLVRPLALFLITLAPISISPTWHSQKPTVVRPFHTEGRGAAATFEELWSRADVVVEGIVGDDSPTDYSVNGLRMVYTMYGVQIASVYKRSQRVTEQTTSIEVRRRGGIRDTGAELEIHEADNFPLFKRGERYIMFLREHEW